MISHNWFWDTKPSDDMIEYRKGYSLCIIWKCRHGHFPFGEIIDNHNNVIMDGSRVSSIGSEMYPSFEKGVDYDFRM